MKISFIEKNRNWQHENSTSQRGKKCLASRGAVQFKTFVDALDFSGKGGEKDVKSVRNVKAESSIPVSSFTDLTDYTVSKGSLIEKAFAIANLEEEREKRLLWIREKLGRVVDYQTLKNKLQDLVPFHFDGWLAQAKSGGRILEATPGKFEIL